MQWEQFPLKNCPKETTFNFLVKRVKASLHLQVFEEIQDWSLLLSYFYTLTTAASFHIYLFSHQRHFSFRQRASSYTRSWRTSWVQSKVGIVAPEKMQRLYAALAGLGDGEKTQPTQGFYHLLACFWLLELGGPRKSNFFYPSPSQLPSLITQTFSVYPPDMPVTRMIIPNYFWETLWSSLLSVMHESSKRVSETLQEIYSSEWDGHEELKAIVGVSVLGFPTLLNSLLPSFQHHLSVSIKQIGKQRSQP